MPKVGPIRAAILGCGQIAHEYASDPKRKGIVTHTQAYLSDPRFVLMGVFDPIEEKRQKYHLKWDVPAYATIETLMMSVKPEVVSICSPANQHLDNIRRILSFDSVKVIFCEKPIATSLSEALKIKQLLSKRPDVSLFVNFSRRYDETYQKLAQQIKLGYLGDIQIINAYYGGSFTSNASHLIDLITWYAGPLTKGYVIGTNQKQPHIIYYLKNGAPVIIQALNSQAYHQFECHFFGTSKKISFLDNGFKIEIQQPSPSTYFSKIKSLKKFKSIKAYRHVFEHALEMIVQQIKTNKKQPTHYLLNESIENLKTVLKA